MRKIWLAFLPFTLITTSEAAYLGIGQYGAEWGKKWEVVEAKLSASVYEFNVPKINNHFEYHDDLRGWFMRKVFSKSILEFKSGASILLSSSQVHESGLT